MKSISQNTLDKLKENKDYFYGLVLGALLCLAIFKQAFGVPLVFIFLISIGAARWPQREYIIIALILLFKVIIIIIIVINNSNQTEIFTAKLIIQRIIISVVLLFMIFMRLGFNNIRGFSHFCIFLLFIDLIFNLYTYAMGVSPYGAIPEKRFLDFTLRVGGLIGHTFYSIAISLDSLFIGLFFKNRIIIAFSIINIVINGSERGLLNLLVLLLISILIYNKINKKYLTIFSLSLLVVIFGVVYCLAYNYNDLIAHQERIARWGAALISVASNPFEIYSWLRLSPQEFPSGLRLYPTMEDTFFKMNGEALYLTEFLNYGYLVALSTLGVYYFVYHIRFREYLSSGTWKSFLQASFSYIIFLDSFFAYSIASIYMIFFYCVFCISFIDE